jgi:hypothetical protein
MAWLGPLLLDRLLDLLIVLLQLVIDGWCWLGRVLRVRSTLQQRPTQTRGSRPPRPTTIGLVFAEPIPQEVSVQRAANLAVWCATVRRYTCRPRAVPAAVGQRIFKCRPCFFMQVCLFGVGVHLYVRPFRCAGGVAASWHLLYRPWRATFVAVAHNLCCARVCTERRRQA